MNSMIYRLKKLPKILIIIGFFLLMVIVGAVISLKPNSKPLEMVTVKKQDLKVMVSASGKLTGNNLLDLRFGTSGKIYQINVKEGNSVQKGQILASLDNREQAIALQQAQNTLRDKQAQADKALDDIHLFQYGMGGFANVATPNETMTQRKDRTTAEVAKDNAFDSVKLAQKNLEDTIIVAPTSGIIIQANFLPGQQIGSTDSIIKLVDTSRIYFDAEIDEVDIGKIALNQKAEITLNAYSQKVFEGEVSEIQLFTKTTSTGATMVTVRILVSPDVAFIDNLSGQVSITTSEAKNVLTIPLEALREDNTVMVQAESEMQPKKVVPGIKSDTEVEIKQGLQEGNRIVVNPPVLPQRRGLFGR